MVAARPGALLATERHPACIQKVAKELPPSRSLKAFHGQRLGNTITCATRRHRPRHTRDPARIAGRVMCVGRQNGKAVGRGHVDTIAKDHVAVAVAIRCRREIRPVFRHDHIHQRFGPDRVWVGVPLAEIHRRHTVQYSAFWCAQHAFKDRGRIRPGHRMHRVEFQRCAAGKHLAYRVEIEQRLHQGGVI